MSVKKIFPSFIYRARLNGALRLNQALKKEIAILETLDGDGRKWSRKNYAGGYSSYSSLTQLHHTSPHFGELKDKLEPHLRKFVRALKLDLIGRRLQMTTCWANSMGAGTYHTLHNHPLCVISGVYYVDMPKGSSSLKLEDPRLPMLMAAPPRRASAPAHEQNYLILDAKAGDLILFESWMRHEVPPHRGRQPRLSVSFNYEF